MLQLSILVDCEWSEWQTLTWQNTGTSSSQTCGGGKRTYSRSKLSAEEYGGKPCSEDSTKTVDNACNTNSCPGINRIPMKNEDSCN